MQDENNGNGTKKNSSSNPEEKLVEKYLSQYLQQENQLLYQKEDYNRLKNNYNKIRSELHNQKRSMGEVYKNYDHVKESLRREEELEIKLETKNLILKNQLESYKNRILVRIINFVQKLLKKEGSKKEKPETTQPLEAKKEKFLPQKSVVTTKNSMNTEPKYLKDIKVALIMDEFSYNSFKYEFNALVVEPDNWREIFQTENPDLFLCESAWHGVNPETKPWTRKIRHSIKSKEENRKELLEILKYCKDNQIPSIFWNKEDPTNFKFFADTAVKFDHVFTSAEECIDCYKSTFNHESVHSLMFAAQPRLFNPIEENDRTNDVIFAGSWYAHFPRRSEEMVTIFNQIIKSGYNLKIYDRAYYNEDPRRKFPDDYKEFLNPPVSHDQMAKLYKESSYGININSVTNSNTMFARRAFELMLCNTLVLSNHSKGLEKLFKDTIVFIDENEINIENNRDMRLKNLYNVLNNHTYTNRFKQILDTINYPYLEPDKTVTIYYKTESPKETEYAIEHFQTVDYPDKKAIILEKTSYNNTELVESLPKYPNITIKFVNTEELEEITNNSPYFIFADKNLKPDFIKKAVLHYMYIETKYGIVEGTNFRFEKSTTTMNTLFNNQEFGSVLSKQHTNEQQKIPVYTIII